MVKIIRLHVGIILKIAMLGELICRVNSQCNVKNYIQNGDFQSWPPPQTYRNATYDFNYTNMTNSSSSWFIKGGGYFLIRTYNNFSEIGLQVYSPVKKSKKFLICQILTTQNLSYYELQYDLIRDGNYNKVQHFVYWNSIRTSHFAEPSNNLLMNYKQKGIIVVGTGNDELCFQNRVVGNPSQPPIITGLVIDNVQLTKLVQTPSVSSYTLQLLDNTLNTFQLSIHFVTSYNESVFDNASIYIDFNEIQNISVSKEDGSNIIVYTLDYNATVINLQKLPSLAIVFKNDVFRTSCSQLTYFNLEQVADDETNKTVETAKVIFKSIAVSIIMIKSFGFSLMLMQIITFSNVLIVYIFTNVSIVPAHVKTALQFAAQVLLQNGIISNIYQFSTTQVFTGFNVNLPLSSSYLQQYQTRGTTFDVIGLTINSFSLCSQDLTIILINLLKAFLLFKALQHLSLKSAKFKILFQNFNNALYEIVIFQFIQPSTSWMILPGLFFAKLNYFTMQNLADKLNLSFIIIYPILIILLCFMNCVFNYRINSKKNKTFVSQRNASQKYKNNIQNNIKQRKINIQNQYKKASIQSLLKFCQNINLVLIGFIVGMQNIIVFFFLTFLFTFIKIFLSLKMWSFNSWYNNLFVIVIKLIELFILIIFLLGFLIQNNLLQIQYDQKIQNIYEKLCISLLYLYISGLLLQFVINLISSVYSLSLLRQRFKAQNILSGGIDDTSKSSVFEQAKIGNKGVKKINSAVLNNQISQCSKLNRNNEQLCEIQTKKDFHKNKVKDVVVIQSKPIHIKFIVHNDLIMSKIKK